MRNCNWGTDSGSKLNCSPKGTKAKNINSTTRGAVLIELFHLLIYLFSKSKGTNINIHI